MSATFTPDPLGNKTFDNNQAALEVSPSLGSDYQTAAEALADEVTGDPALLAGILPEGLPSIPTDREHAFLQAFGARAFRRPLSAPELSAKAALFEHGAALYPDLDPFAAGVRVSIAALLQSPYFIYRSELSGGPQQGTVAPLSDWELASRLSYAVWNSMPDDELFRAAGAGELSSGAGLSAQLERMLQDPRAHATIQSFFDQLYDGDQYSTLSKSLTVYPDFVPEIAADMRGELDKFTTDVFEQGGGVRELFTSTQTFVTPRLAALYGITGDLPTPDNDGFSRVTLDPAERSGLLTRAGFLAWKAKDTQPSTILRGVFVVRKVTCRALGNPPPAAQGATLGDQPTDRERVNALTGPGTCGANCHGTIINPAGFAFEHFGAMGEYRTEDGELPVDSSASYPFEQRPVAFANAAEFSQALADSPEVHACFVGYLLQYLLGRDHVAADDALTERLTASSLSNASLHELLVTALESNLFRYPIVTAESR